MPFNTKAEFDIPILSDGEKRAVVKWPPDALWCERSRKRVIVRHVLSAQKTQSDVPAALTADAELFRAICKNGDADNFNEAEASAIIDRLETCRVIDTVRAGNEISVEMKVPGGRVTHRLQIPNQKDVREYGAAAVRSVICRHHIEDRVRLEPSGDLWAQCKGRAEGYAEGSDVPIIHKDVAVVEVLSLLRAATEESDPEE
jgi:hypothetical protein